MKTKRFTRSQDMDNNTVIYFGAVDELKGDVKLLKLHMSRLAAAIQKPSSKFQTSTSSSFSSKPP